MKSLNLRARASYIVVLAMGMTLFASQPGFAQNQNRQNQVSQGTNGGGGGGAIICPGKEPILTDYWELSQVASYDTVKRLEELRKLDYPQALAAFVKKFQIFFGFEARPDLVLNAAKRLMNVTYKAIQQGGTAISQDSIVHVKVDRTVADPKDSGVIEGLGETNCKEERVIISHFESASENGVAPILNIRIRRPDLFLRLPVFDQIGLLFGHEMIHAQAAGNTGRLLTLGKVTSNSETTRRLNAWLTIAEPSDLRKASQSFKQNSRQVLHCNVKMPENNLHDGINFRFHLQNNRTIVEFINYKNQIVVLPTFAILPISFNQFVIPQNIKTGLRYGEIGKRFDLKINLSQPAKANIRQVESDITQAKTVNTGLTIQFMNEEDLTAKVENSKGEVEFYGDVNCYRQLFEGEED